MLTKNQSNDTRKLQAHFINTRTMEILSRLPVGDGCISLAASVTARSPPLDDWRKFVYCEHVLGCVLGEVDHFEVNFLSCSHISRFAL